MQRTSAKRVSLTGLVLYSLVLLCAIFADPIQQQMQVALTRCLTCVIPSLYAMMILSQLLLCSGAWRMELPLLSRILSPLLGLPSQYISLFLLSQFAGYPVGASMLCTLVRQNALRQEDARKLLCVCYGGGPAFLLGLLGNISCRRQAFWLIFGANVLTNLLLCQLLFRRHPVSPPEPSAEHISLHAAQLVQSTAEAGRLLLKLCGMILCFSAICAAAEAVGLLKLAAVPGTLLHQQLSLTSLWKSILELTCAVDLTLPINLRIPVFAALTAFGGVCVLLQIRAVVGNTIPMGFLVKMRLLAAGVSGLLCAAGTKLLPDLTNTAVQETAAGSAAAPPQSVFPAVMLLVMMLLVFREEHALTE